jgi:glycine cleavage system protein P-like pyridoxal-binding family
MSNGEFCCAIGLCCPPASASRRSALINELSHGTGESHAAMEKVADWLIANVEMLPKGSVDLPAIAELMRKQSGG